MRRFYSRVRVALMTFTLGLATVWMMNAIAIANRGVSVELPKAKSADVLYVFPAESKYVRAGDGGGGASGMCVSLSNDKCRRTSEVEGEIKKTFLNYRRF